MLDTFAISKTFVRPPNQEYLKSNGWKARFDNNSEVKALIFNSQQGRGQPRLTLSQTPNELWVIRAEVSLGSWLFNSNLHLPDRDDLQHGLDLLSDYVKAKSGVIFDAHKERVTRVDFTHDFQVGGDVVIQSLKKLSDLKIAKYDRICFDETSVYFKNSGKEKNKTFLIYSKYHEMKKKNKPDYSNAKGILRLEVSLRNNAVNKLAKSLKLQSHHANYILTEKTSEAVIQKAISQLHIKTFIKNENSNYEKLFELHDASTALRLIGYLTLKKIYGENLSEIPFVNISQKTLSRYKTYCAKAGVLSLE